MAKKNNGTLPAELEAELDKVRNAAPPSPSDDPIYKYLRRVYGLRRMVASSPEFQKAIQTHHQAYYPKTLAQYGAVIIQMTAGDHVTSKMKHKYATTLEYAYNKDIKPKNLESFIKEQGGINKCVELWSKTYGRSAVKKQPKKKAVK